MNSTERSATRTEAVGPLVPLEATAPQPGGLLPERPAACATRIAFYRGYEGGLILGGSSPVTSAILHKALSSQAVAGLIDERAILTPLDYDVPLCGMVGMPTAERGIRTQIAAGVLGYLVASGLPDQGVQAMSAYDLSHLRPGQALDKRADTYLPIAAWHAPDTTGRLTALVMREAARADGGAETIVQVPSVLRASPDYGERISDVIMGLGDGHAVRRSPGTRDGECMPDQGHGALHVSPPLSESEGAVLASRVATLTATAEFPDGAFPVFSARQDGVLVRV